MRATKSVKVLTINEEVTMQRVLVVCVAGAASTFLARRLNDLAAASDLELTFSPTPLETLRDTDDIVALSAHVASPDVLDDLTARGVRFVVLPDTVRGGFGAEDALSAVSAFVGKDGGRSDSTVESLPLKGNN